MFQKKEILWYSIKEEIVIVVDMWLTGFDVPDLPTMYIDRPMKGHNLMQAIARVNRVYKDKEAGLIVDYIGIGADLKLALNEYTNRDRDKIPNITAAYAIVREKLEIMRDIFYGFDYSDFFGYSNQARLKILTSGINYILSQREESKKESARAFMRREIKRLLRKYGYPPEKADDAVQMVVRQAELMGANMEEMI